jgi:hypothetical protein
MAGRIRACAALALATAALAPATAQAFSISHFRVGRSGELELKYEVTVCGARGYRLAFQAALVQKGDPRSRRLGVLFWKAAERSPTFHGVQRRNCFKRKLETEDVWIGGIWGSQMTVYLRGQTRRTAWTVFDNCEAPCRAPSERPPGARC